MPHSYEVYVGDLPITISKEQLENLFSQVGEVLNVWINQSFKKITYGFVEFTNVISAENACEQFNDLKLDFSQIKVRLSARCKQKLEVKVRTPNDNIELPKAENYKVKRPKSILLELPMKKGKSKNHQIKEHLIKDLTRNKEIIKDFQKACLEAENIAFPQECETVYTSPEQTNLETLETTIIRYFKARNKSTRKIDIDIDLSNGKRLTTQENDKFFNIQLTKPRPVKTVKPEKPFALDYRSVVDH